MSGSQTPPPAVASPVAGREPPAFWKRATLWTLSVAAVGGLLWLTTGPQATKEEAPVPAGPESAGQIGAPFAPPLPPRATQAALPQPPVPLANPMPVAAGAAYAPAPLMAFGSEAQVRPRPVADSQGEREQAQPPQQPEPDALSARMRSEDQPTAVATRLPDRDLFLTEGTPVLCLPDAPVTSDVEGAFRCKVRGAVYGTSGSVPLLDDGTWIRGNVQGGLRRGQRRLFVTFTRMETPQGCLVRIRAPGADALGQNGLDGQIDTHFFQRFGGYIGMAFLDAGMQAAVLAASNAVARNRGGFSLFQFQNAGRQGGRDLFQDDIAIPPTLYRNQAEPIVVRLTQDVDMRPCFRLRTVGGGR